MPVYCAACLPMWRWPSPRNALGFARMTTFVRSLALGLAALNVFSGIFLDSMLAMLEVRISPSTELRWVLIVGMPVLLLLSCVRQGPARTALDAAIQSIGLLAIAFSPALWALRHAQ